jgi:hypothetical protein
LRKGESPFCQVRKGKKKKARWAQVESASRESFSFSGAFKTYTTPREGRPKRFPPNNEGVRKGMGR